MKSLSELRGVPETLVIPLLARANSRKLLPGLEFDDPTACAWVKELQLERSSVNREKLLLRSCIARAQVLDRITTQFLAVPQRTPVTIISIGAGLCSRSDRLGLSERLREPNSDLRWIDLDLPEVIQIRESFRPAKGSHQYIARSLTDPKWTKGLTAEIRGRRVLILIEGVFVYLTPSEVSGFFSNTTQSLLDQGATELLFACDVLDGVAHAGTLLALPFLSRAIPESGSKIQWAPLSLQAFLTEADPRLLIRERVEFLSALPAYLAVPHRFFELIRGHGCYSVASIAAHPS